MREPPGAPSPRRCCGHGTVWRWRGDAGERRKVGAVGISMRHLSSRGWLRAASDYTPREQDDRKYEHNGARAPRQLTSCPGCCRAHRWAPLHRGGV